jgi:hypothetical protein
MGLSGSRWIVRHGPSYAFAWKRFPFETTSLRADPA